MTLSVRFVSRAAEIDAQLVASVTIREQLMREGFQFKQEGPFRWTTTDLRALFLVGPAANLIEIWRNSRKPEFRCNPSLFLRVDAKQDGCAGQARA